MVAQDENFAKKKDKTNLRHLIVTGNRSSKIDVTKSSVTTSHMQIAYYPNITTRRINMQHCSSSAYKHSQISQTSLRYSNNPTTTNHSITLY